MNGVDRQTCLTLLELAMFENSCTVGECVAIIFFLLKFIVMGFPLNGIARHQLFKMSSRSPNN